MKKATITVIALLMTMNLFAQSNDEKKENEAYQMYDNCDRIHTYRLIPAGETWNFIKLNTRTGQLWVVKYDVKEKKRYVTTINDVALVDKQKEVDNRFILYPSNYSMILILLDQYNGKTWQVEWSGKPGKNRIIPLE